MLTPVYHGYKSSLLVIAKGHHPTVGMANIPLQRSNIIGILPARLCRPHRVPTLSSHGTHEPSTASVRCLQSSAQCWIWHAKTTVAHQRRSCMQLRASCVLHSIALPHGTLPDKSRFTQNFQQHSTTHLQLPHNHVPILFTNICQLVYRVWTIPVLGNTWEYRYWAILFSVLAHDTF